jgi:hypothetical protein
VRRRRRRRRSIRNHLVRSSFIGRKKTATKRLFDDEY